VCIALAACQATRPTPTLDVPLIPLREVLPQLKLAAVTWRGDAYLAVVDLPLDSFGFEGPHGGWPYRVHVFPERNEH